MNRSAAALLRSRSTGSAMRRQLQGCGGGGVPRQLARGYAAKELPVGRAAVEEDSALGVDGRAAMKEQTQVKEMGFGVDARGRAAVKEYTCFGIDARVGATLNKDAIFGVGARIGVNNKVKEEMAFGVDAGALLRALNDLAFAVQDPHKICTSSRVPVLRALNDLADAVKSTEGTPFCNETRTALLRALDHLALTVELQEGSDLVEDLAMTLEAPAAHSLRNQAWAPHGHGHPATTVLSTSEDTMFSACKAGLPLLCSTRKPGLGLSKTHVRHFCSNEGEQTTEARKKEEDEKKEKERVRKEQEEAEAEAEELKRKNEQEENYIFILFKKIENLLKSWKLELNSMWADIPPQKKHFLQLLLVFGFVEVAGGLVFIRTYRKGMKSVDDKFTEHTNATAKLRHEQEIQFSVAEGLAAGDREKEASQRTKEAMKRSRFAEEQLGAMGTQMYEFQSEMNDLKRILQKLQQDVEEAKEEANKKKAGKK